MSSAHISYFDNDITMMTVNESNFDKWCKMIHRNTRIPHNIKEQVLNKIMKIFKKNNIDKQCVLDEESASETSLPKKLSPKSSTPRTGRSSTATRTRNTPAIPVSSSVVNTNIPSLNTHQNSKLSLEYVDYQDILQNRIEKYREIEKTLHINKNDVDLIFDEIFENLILVKQSTNEIVVNFNKNPLANGGTFGIAYGGKITQNNRRIAAKLQLNSKDSKKELAILEYLTYVNTVSDDRNIHFPILYKNFLLSIKGKKIDLYPSFLNKSNTHLFNVSISEIANGDFKKFIKQHPSDTIFSNAIAQIFMAIASFHSKKIMHNDTHNGNFLYFKVKPGGYIKYTIEGQEYYIENLGYIWIIWDFGICTPIYRNYDYMRDYEMFSLFIRHKTDDVNTHFPVTDLITKNKTYRKHGNVDAQINIPDNVQAVAKFIDDICGHTGMVADLHKIRTEYGQESIFLKEVFKILNSDVKTSQMGNVIADVNISFTDTIDEKNNKLWSLLDHRG